LTKSRLPHRAAARLTYFAAAHDQSMIQKFMMVAALLFLCKRCVFCFYHLKSTSEIELRQDSSMRFQ